MVYEKELTEISKAGIRYLVVGGIALFLHRHPRLTDDLDIIPDLEQENLAKLTNVLKDLGYKPKLPYVTIDDFKDQQKRKSWITEKHMKAFSLINDRLIPYNVIDLLIASPLNFEESYKRRHIENLDGVEIPVASLEDLLTLKLEANRAKDFADIIVLQKFILRRKDD